MHPHPKTTSTHDLSPILQYIRKHFYKTHDTRYHTDKTMLLYALTWPATWLDQHALRITPEHYQTLLTEQLHKIQQHGDPKHYDNYFPRYLLTCLQRWIHHNHDTLYEQLKHASHSIEQIANHIAAIQPEHNHTTLLAQAHQILSQNYRRKNNPEPSNQITLGL